MRNIWTVLALTMLVGCGGGDGKDGDDGAQGPAGPAGVNGKDGDDGTNGTNGTNGTPGAKGEDGAPGTNGTNGTNGTDGSSVRTGTGVPAVGLGVVGDVYIDSATGDLYAKSAGGWTKTGSLKGPAGSDGTDGTDAGATLRGAPWFAFALTAAFLDAPQLITSETYTAASSSATFTFTGAAQHGRLAFDTTGTYLPGGVNLSSFESLSLNATLTGGAATKLVVVLADGGKRGCQWDLTVAGGPVYSVDLTTPTSCFNTSLGDPAFSLDSVTQVQIGVQSSAAGARTLTINDINFVDSL